MGRRREAREAAIQFLVARDLNRDFDDESDGRLFWILRRWHCTDTLQEDCRVIVDDLLPRLAKIGAVLDTVREDTVREDRSAIVNDLPPRLAKIDAVLDTLRKDKLREDWSWSDIVVNFLSRLAEIGAALDPLRRNTPREDCSAIVDDLLSRLTEIDAALDTLRKDKLREDCGAIVDDLLPRLDEIDAVLDPVTDNYDLERLSTVDRNILRVAVYEMFHRPDIPPIVSINEAIEIAKRFGTEESGRFVNGILDRLVKDLTRPLRDPAPDPGHNP